MCMYNYDNSFGENKNKQALIVKLIINVLYFTQIT